MAKRLPFADEEGNLLPELDPASELAQIIFLMEYARKRGFQIGPVIQVGGTIIQVRDLRLKAGGGEQPKETDIWEEHGHKENG